MKYSVEKHREHEIIIRKGSYIVAKALTRPNNLNVRRELRSGERVFKALGHEKPDRVPLDDAWLGWGVHRLDTWDAIKQLFSTNDDEQVRRALGFDFRLMVVGFSEQFAKQAELIYPFGSYKPIRENVFEDEYGVRYQKSATGLHWRYIHHPLEDAEDPDEYEFPDFAEEARYEQARDIVKQYRDNYAIQGLLHQTFYEGAWTLRSFRRFSMDLINNPRFVHKLLDKLLKVRTEAGKRYVELGADIVQLGDDVGHQMGMMISPAVWREYFKPRMKLLIQDLRKHSRNGIHIYYHCDGNIKPIIPELMEIGVDILNPVQPEAMNPDEVKTEFGDRLVLHGTISVQETIAHGSVEDVKTEVADRIRRCGKNGGLIIAPAHAPQPSDPMQNIIALYETARSIRSP